MRSLGGASVFGRRREVAEATILSSRVTGRTSTGYSVAWEFVVEVRPVNGPPFRTVVQSPRITTTFLPPTDGATVNVTVDARRQKARFDTSDPRLKMPTTKDRSADLQRFADVLAGTAPPSRAARLDLNTFLAGIHDGQADPQALAAMLGAQRGEPDFGSKDPIGLLGKLSELRAQGVLTAEEFEAQKARLLGRRAGPT